MRAIILIAALLGACTPHAGAPIADVGATPGDAQASSAVPTTLAGEWRVAGIDGEALDEPYGVALSADGEEIWWEPRCAGQSVRYRIEQGRFDVVSPPAASTSGGAIVCKIGLPPKLPDVMDAIRAADRIERTPENGIKLSGEGRSLTLFSQ